MRSVPSDSRVGAFLIGEPVSTSRDMRYGSSSCSGRSRAGSGGTAGASSAARPRACALRRLSFLERRSQPLALGPDRSACLRHGAVLAHFRSCVPGPRVRWPDERLKFRPFGRASILAPATRLCTFRAVRPARRGPCDFSLP